ncbi:ISH7-type transposase ISHgi17 (plasmid) [Haloferax gibbonsii]|uniref:ISH7-type transposase ISHgi17 n=1 Tax=Haloferax gibbonsii TaxID=35746 RepID=A0A871BL49_HALGI|nr:transposase [Haloferax gibbonsii]QOS13510.1 ISH7-type transposase ISHgi17 [Haloferax gibbonsii]
MVSTAEAKQVCRAASTLLYPALDFGIKPCGTYTREDFLEVLSRIAFDHEFANTGGKTVQLARSEPVDVTSTARNLLAKSLLYHLRNLDTAVIDTQFDGVRDRLFQVLRARRLLPPRVDVAIDLHEWRFYGSADTDHVLITYPDLGTNRAYCFATLCIVAPNVRFTLAAIPMDANGFRAKQEAVRSLILTARRYVPIRHVYLDRGFYQVHVVQELEHLGVNYMVRARPSKGMKDRLSAGAETIVDSYRMQRNRPPTAAAEVTVFAVAHRTSEDEYVWFVTNLDVEPETARAYAAAFRRRWGIETSYRKIGDFLPRTSSPTFSVRLFYFLFAVALYNLWVLANVLVSGGSIPSKPQISTRIFRTLLIPHGYG